MPRAAFIALLASLAACVWDTGSVDETDDTSTDATSTSDGVTVGDGDGDAASTTTGDGDGNALVVEFASDPAVPGTAGGDLAPTFEVASLTLRDVRVIGDAGALEARAVDIDWTTGAVDRLRFAPVVPGLYSRVRGEVSKIDLRGTIAVGGQRREFEIKADGNMLAEFSTDVSRAVGPDEEVVLTLTAELAELVEAVEWSEVCDADRCEVEKNDPALGPVLEELRELFEPDDDSDDAESGDDERGGGDESDELSEPDLP